MYRGVERVVATRDVAELFTPQASRHTSCMAGMTTNAEITSSAPAHLVSQAIEAVKHTTQSSNPRCQACRGRFQSIHQVPCHTAAVAAPQRRHQRFHRTPVVGGRTVPVNQRGRQVPPEAGRPPRAATTGDESGSISSPRPRQIAAPSPKKNGMSLPSSAARRASSARGQPSCHAALAASSADAASLDAPPSPAADGMRLIRWIAAPAVTPAASRNRSTARTTKLFPLCRHVTQEIRPAAHGDFPSPSTSGCTARQSYSDPQPWS